MGQSTVSCGTFDEFMRVVVYLTKENILFSAHADELKVVIRGY